MTISRWIGLFVLGGLALLGWFVEPVAAEPEDPAPLTQGVDNQLCLSCHSALGQTLELPSGEQLYITVAPDVYNASVHGQKGYACVQCHTDITGYPHPDIFPAVVP